MPRVGQTRKPTGVIFYDCGGNQCVKKEREAEVGQTGARDERLFFKEQSGHGENGREGKRSKTNRQ